MQTSFFSTRQSEVEEIVPLLETFQFRQAAKAIGQLSGAGTFIPNKKIYIRCLNYCGENGLNASSASQEIIHLWEILHQEQACDGQASPNTRFLFKIFAKRLLDLDAFDKNGLLQNHSHIFHRSACLMQRQKFSEAYKSLRDFLSRADFKIPARYWGYFGDASHRLHKMKEANLGYLRLLAQNPFDVDWSTFQHQTLAALFEKQFNRHGLQKAYGLWPFYAWANKYINVPQNHLFISELLENTSAQHDLGLEPTAMERLHEFKLLVFHEQALGKPGAAPEIRRRMRELEPALFQLYLSIISQ